MQKWRPWRVVLGATLAAWLVTGPAGSLSVSASSRVAGSSATARTHVGSTPPPPAGPPPGGLGGSGRGTPPRASGHPPAPGPAPGILGTVVAVGSSGFTMTAAGSTYRVEAGSSTVYILAPGWTTTSLTVVAGDQVSVQGSVSGAQITARTVSVHGWGITARITDVSGDAAAVVEPSGRTAVLRFDSAPGLAVGRTVQAVGTWQGDALTVRAYRIPPDQIEGTVTALGTDHATVQTGAGTSVTVAWSAKTMFAEGPKATAGASAVVVGAHMHAQGVLSGSTLQATLVDVGPVAPAPHRPRSG